jgi:hypothetical protein
MLWADGKFVAVGGIAGGILEAPVMTSTDGMNWVSQSSGVTGSLEGLAWGNGRFIATAWDRIVVSTDGLRWVPQRIRRRNGGTGIAWGKNTFVVVDGYYILQSDPFFGLKMQNPAELTVSALPGQSFRIEAASELNDAGVWQPLATLTLTNSSYLWRDDSANLPDRRFYRAVLVP